MFCAPRPVFIGIEVSCSVFMFGAPRLILGGTESVGSRFHVLRTQTRFGRFEGAGSSFHVLRSRSCFRRYRGRQTNFGRYRACLVHFSCFALLDSFLIVLRASGPLFMFCAPGLVFCCTEGAESCFHFLRYRVCRVQFSHFAHPNSFWTGAQNIKTRPDALDTAENESGSAKYENGNRRPRYSRKRLHERKT
jgi:hypothetical protein